MRLLTLLLIGCASGSPPSDEQTRRQVCLFGAFDYPDGANPWIADICDGFPGLVVNPADGREGFLITDFDEAVEAMIEALDTDADGLVTDDDTVILDVLGYSWGGVNATRIDLHADPRVQTTRPLIGRMVLADPFVPPAGEFLTLAGPVERVWNYGHSVSPPWDCSGTSPLGPYAGRPLDCSSTDAPCTHYDVSIRTTVGHCTIVLEIADWVSTNILEGTDAAPERLIVDPSVSP